MLADVVEDVLRVLGAHEQNVDWTARWATSEEMTAELRDHLARLRREDFSRLAQLKSLFLPTGPLQEVSLSSGWGAEYLTLATRFDRAVRAAEKTA
ncbi:hypothetical protein [Streptomyces winkii]|uniref:hypothetical protein n=1 Tax=Streptomyces winkii TaxID=3051178 RepID=UPI0028D36C65|nr:hypothetical protein [Streptomyces sp. DSM 40971]